MSNPVTFRNPTPSSSKTEEGKPKLDWAHLTPAQLPEEAAVLLQTLIDADRELRAFMMREVVPPQGKVVVVSTPVDVKRGERVGIAFADKKTSGPDVTFRNQG